MQSKRRDKRQKAQTTIVLLVLVVIIFGMLILFLFSFTETLGQEEYMPKHLNNLLISMVRTDTGYTGSNCKLIQDALGCTFLRPTDYCEGSTERCVDVAETRVTYYMDKFETIKESFRYFFKAEPSWWAKMGDETIVFEVGDPSVEDADEKIIESYTVWLEYPLYLTVSLSIAKA